LLQRATEFFPTVGEGALELSVHLLAMILVERSLGQEGLGIYSYLLSLFMIGGYLSAFGIPHYVERETAFHHDKRQRQGEILTNAFQAICWLGLLVAGFCFLSASYDTTHTQIQEKLAAYLIIGLTIPIRNLNKLKLAVLHGLGNHEQVAKLEAKKRIAFLLAIFLLLKVHTPPSYLALSFLLGELFLMVMAARKVALPRINTIWNDLGRLGATLRGGYNVLFTDEAFEIVLYIDLLILGFYVPAWDLGVYTEAFILARLVLLIPLSVRPIFRRKYCLLVVQRGHGQTSRMVYRATTIFFYLHSLLVLYILLYFPAVLHFFFWTHGEELLSFRIFTVLLPGLLYCASVTASEPIYEATGRVESLRKIVLIVFLTNTALNFYLVPFAGFFGAAAATTFSMLLYFFLFGWHLPEQYKMAKSSFLVAGGSVYLVYLLMERLDSSLAIAIWMLPIPLFLLMFLIGFFNFEPSLESIADVGKTQI